MYTEVSFFENAVVLPAIFYNPLDGPSRLNEGSGFYYGFALTKNPKEIYLETNMPSYEDRDKTAQWHNQFFISSQLDEEVFHMEIIPSREMAKFKSSPYFYRENKSYSDLKKRSTKKASSLGKAPINAAMYFKMNQMQEGEHIVSFQLFFEKIPQLVDKKDKTKIHKDSLAKIIEFKNQKKIKVFSSRIRKF